MLVEVLGCVTLLDPLDPLVVSVVDGVAAPELLDDTRRMVSISKATENLV